MNHKGETKCSYRLAYYAFQIHCQGKHWSVNTKHIKFLNMEVTRILNLLLKFESNLCVGVTKHLKNRAL